MGKTNRDMVVIDGVAVDIVVYVLDTNIKTETIGDSVRGPVDIVNVDSWAVSHMIPHCILIVVDGRLIVIHYVIATATNAWGTSSRDIIDTHAVTRGNSSSTANTISLEGDRWLWCRHRYGCGHRCRRGYKRGYRCGCLRGCNCGCCGDRG